MKPFKLVVLSLVLALGATSCRYLETAAAVVGGKVITMRELDALIASQLQKGATDSQKLDAERRELAQLIQDRIITAEAARRHIVISQADVDATYQRIRSSFGSDAQFQQALQQQGVDPGSVKDRIKERLVVNDIQKTLTSQITVADAELRAAYGTGKQFDSVDVRHILFAVRSQTPAEYKKALAKAEAALKQLRAGANFAELAKKLSDDKQSGKQGGMLGSIQRGRTVPEFEAAAFSLKVGEISNPVRTQFGYHIIQVLKKSSKTFEQAAPGLRTQIETQKAQSAFNQFLSKLLAQADVRVNPKLGQFDPTTLTIVQRTFYTPAPGGLGGAGGPASSLAPIPVQS
ncbi:MAG: peptidylprolyl isomerase [Actinomycetota bacterium]